VHSKKNGKVERKEYLLFLGRGKQAQSLKAENAEGGDGLEAIHRSIGMYQDKTQFNQETWAVPLWKIQWLITCC